MTKDYETLWGSEQKLRDREVLEKISHFFCGSRGVDDYKKRLVRSAYKIYWREVKDKRKALGTV